MSITRAKPTRRAYAELPDDDLSRFVAAARAAKRTALSEPEAKQVLRAHMANLRGKVERDGRPRLIHTDPGVGYRLDG